jgi:hypothetical protein
MDPFPGQRHIRRHAVEGQPQVLNSQLRPEGLRQRPVEIVPRKQAGDGIGEVQEADVAAHVGEPAAAAGAHYVEVAVRAPQRAHEGADAHAAHLVDGDARLNDGSGPPTTILSVILQSGEETCRKDERRNKKCTQDKSRLFLKMFICPCTCQTSRKNCT